MAMAMAMVGGAACASAPGDEALDPRRAGHEGPRGRFAGEGSSGRPVAQHDWSEAGDTGRFRLRIERGLVGVAELDATIEGSFDRRRSATEVVLDLRALSKPLTGEDVLQWPAEAPTELVVRTVGDLVFVHTGQQPLPWVVFPDGGDPLGAREVASAHDPERLLQVVARAAPDLEVVDGGMVDGVDTVRHTGWLSGAALGELDQGRDGGDRLAALAGMAPAELVDRLVRVDLWVGHDGVPRRLVIEWDLDTLAAVARRHDGTDRGIDRLRYRTEVVWFDLGADVEIDEPPRHLVGVIDPTGTR